MAKVLGGELALYFVVKALRRDMWYWMPLYGVSGGGVSFIARLVVKVIGDWASIVQMRHPPETGGFYFVISLLVTITIGIVAADGFEEVEGEEDTLTKETVMKTMTTCCVGMIVSFVALLCSMKKAYIHTLLSTKTENKHLHDNFTNNEGDEAMFNIFTVNKHKWRKVIGSEVKAWLYTNIPIWLEEQPAWFNEHAMSVIPEDNIDDPEILAHIRTRNVQEMIQERRGSFMGRALMLPVPTPKRGDEVEEEVGKADAEVVYR